MASRTALRALCPHARLLLARRLASTTSELIPQYETGDALSRGRTRPKLRSVDTLPPKPRGPPAIEDTWSMRLGDTVWYLIFGSLFGLSGYAIYEAIAGVRHRYKKGKSFLDQFPPDERPEQFLSPQSPFTLESTMQPNEAYPFVMEDKSLARRPGEYPREPPMLEKMLQADTFESRKKLKAKREELAAKMAAERDATKGEQRI